LPGVRQTAQPAPPPHKWGAFTADIAFTAAEDIVATADEMDTAIARP